MAWSDRDIQNLNSADVNLSTSKTIVWASRVFTWINVRLLPALKSMAVAVSAASGKADELDAAQQNKMNRDYSNAPAHTRQSVQKLLGIGTTTNDVGKAPILNNSLNGFQWGVVGDGKTTLSSSIFYTPTFDTGIVVTATDAETGLVRSIDVQSQITDNTQSFDEALKLMANLPDSAVIVKAQKSGTSSNRYAYTVATGVGGHVVTRYANVVTENYRIGYRTIIPPGTLP